MSSSSVQAGDSIHDALGKRHTVKRRKIRKGTFSCWECKHRKARCEFKPVSSSSCVTCHRRGLPCISQEFADPADSNHNRHGEVEDRIVHVEALVSRLVEERSVQQSQLSQGPSHSNAHGEFLAPIDMAEQADADDNIRRHLSSFLATTHELGSHSLGNHLHSILPHPTVAALILSRGKFCSLPLHIRRQPLGKSRPPITSAEQLAQVSKLPSPQEHPIHFARKLIQLALCLQQLDVTTTELADLQLKPVRDAAQRFVAIASRYVTSQDFLVDSPDGLETLMLEACYHINVGNLRSAWLLFRRAIAIAQLLGLPQASQKSDYKVQLLWFRLIHGNLYLSLMLGLPFAIADSSVARNQLLGAIEPPGSIERTHVVLIGRIIARNIQMQRNQRGNHDKETEVDVYDDYKETLDIDYELKQANRSLPANWWVLPALKTSGSEDETREKTAKLISQMDHHFLLVVLHQPYLMHASGLHPTTSTGASAGYSFDSTYSKTAGLSASREVLSRFLIIRDFHRVSSYRGLDDKAFTASIILLLVHLDGHRFGRANVLEHQRPQDLGIVKDVIHSLEETSCFNRDAQGRSNADQLKMFLDIEADAAHGAKYTTIFLEENPSGQQGCEIIKEVDGLKLFMPYFGTLQIARQRRMAQQVGQDSSSELAAELSLDASVATGYNNLGTRNRVSSLTRGPLPSDSQLLSPDTTCASFVSNQQALDVQDCLPPETNVDPEFFTTWLLEETQTDETLLEAEMWPTQSSALEGL